MPQVLRHSFAGIANDLGFAAKWREGRKETRAINLPDHSGNPAFREPIVRDASVSCREGARSADYERLVPSRGVGILDKAAKATVGDGPHMDKGRRHRAASRFRDA
jgi:hypothetical protein